MLGAEIAVEKVATLGESKVINPHKTTLRKKYIWFDTISGLRYNSLINKEWREGVGVEPTRDVYSPILDLKSRRPTGTSTLPLDERWYSVREPVSR